jgi:Tfp pilus assembly PilM family ATPase
MARILAIDWDRHEVRGVIVASGPTGASVTGAWAAPLARTDNSALSGREIGQRLAAAITGGVDGKVTTLVGAGRDNVQMQLLSLPPAPDDELPELVRYQAEREFTALGSDAALDFIPITGDSQTPHQVLAVALNATGLAEAREIGEALGVEPDRIPLRACAAAELVRRAGVVPAGKVALVVNPLTDEADLTVLVGDKVVLMRTVRLPEPSQSEDQRRALVGEIRRTMAAVRQQSADRSVDRVVVCGHPAQLDQGGGLPDALDVPVTLFDPTTYAPSGLSVHGVPAESLGRFAAVLGMALGEADRRPPIVDFANVRRRHEARRFTRVHALAAAAAALAVLWFAAHLWRQASDPARELAHLENRIEHLQTQAQMYKDVTTQAAAVERWLATDVNWLDELERFARRVRPQPLSAKEFSVNDDVVVTQLTMLRPPGINAVGGRMDVQAKAKSDTAVRDLEQRLRDERHHVTPGGVQQDSTVPGYPRALDLQVYVTPTTEEEADKPAEAAP